MSIQCFPSIILPIFDLKMKQLYCNGFVTGCYMDNGGYAQETTCTGVCGPGGTTYAYVDDGNCGKKMCEGITPCVTNFNYSGSTHTSAQCSSAGGTLVTVAGDASGTEVCRFTAASCLSGWVHYSPLPE